MVITTEYTYTFDIVEKVTFRKEVHLYRSYVVSAMVCILPRLAVAAWVGARRWRDTASPAWRAAGKTPQPFSQLLRPRALLPIAVLRRLPSARKIPVAKKKEKSRQNKHISIRISAGTYEKNRKTTIRQKQIRPNLADMFRGPRPLSSLQKSHLTVFKNWQSHKLENARLAFYGNVWLI